MTDHRSPNRARSAKLALAVALLAPLLAGPASPLAHASGPYVFCERTYSNYDTCVGGEGHTFAQVQARDLNGSNRVCATQKSGSDPSSPNQYSYACADYSAGVVNNLNLFGYPAAHNGENFSQIMRGQFYLP